MNRQYITDSFSVRALCIVLFSFALSFTGSAYASPFKVGETVFVGYPASNIKDDAFIVGTVQAITKKGDYQISVVDFVEGHDYGVSCVPMVKYDNPQAISSEYGQAWELWQDTTTLNKEVLDYVVSKDDVMKLEEGKHFFIERYNLYIVFGRWKSDAPMLTIDRLTRAEREATGNQLSGLLPALALVKLHRSSFYGEYGRPLQPFESIAELNKALVSIIDTFAENDALKRLWTARNRDWKQISEDMQTYFLIEAIDKVVADADRQQYAEGVEQAGEEALNSLKSYLAQLKRDAV